MKKLLIAVIGLGMSWVVSAETYDVLATYSAGSEYAGELVFRVDEGKSASFSNEQIQDFSVSISKKSGTQMLVNFRFEGGDYKSEAEVILDLNRISEFNFGKQSFTFLVKQRTG